MVSNTWSTFNTWFLKMWAFLWFHKVQTDARHTVYQAKELFTHHLPWIPQTHSVPSFVPFHPNNPRKNLKLHIKTETPFVFVFFFSLSLELQKGHSIWGLFLFETTFNFFMWILTTMSGLEELRKKLAPLFDAEKGFSSSSTLDPCDSYTVTFSQSLLFIQTWS